MRHGSLFSGIGAADLAAEWMGWENVFQVEINSFCSKVLEKNFPKTKRYGDIKKFNGIPHRGSIDVLSGGFPCQPYSSAGERKGKEDDRHLWPEYRRIIEEVQPSFVVGENVYGILNWSGGLVFDEVQTDLENLGYEVTPFILPACGVNAPHKRDRVWFIAYSNRYGHQLWGLDENRQPAITCKSIKEKWQWVRHDSRRNGKQRTSPNAQSNRDRGRLRCLEVAYEGFRQSEKHWENNPELRDASKVWDVANTNSGKRSEGRMRQRGNDKRAFIGNGGAQTDWRAWQNFPTQSPICRRNDGVSQKLDFPNRADRIKSLGNTMVPQLVYQIFKAIEETYLTTLNQHPMKTLNVVKTSFDEVCARWNTSGKFMDRGELFIRCNSKAQINWDKAPVYTWKEIQKQQTKRRVCFLVPKEAF